MDHLSDTDKINKSSVERTQIKYRYGNFNLYSYKDPYGKTIQVVRPAIVKIKTID